MSGFGEDWTPEKCGRALAIIHILANMPPEQWRTKRELHDALAEFRTDGLVDMRALSLVQADGTLLEL